MPAPTRALRRQARTTERRSGLVVVGHATRPQLDLPRAQARELTTGRAARWHGLRVVRGLPRSTGAGRRRT